MAFCAFCTEQVTVTCTEEMQFSSLEYILDFRDTTSHTFLVGHITDKMFSCNWQQRTNTWCDILFSQILVTVLFSWGEVLSGHFFTLYK